MQGGASDNKPHLVVYTYIHTYTTKTCGATNNSAACAVVPRVDCEWYVFTALRRFCCRVHLPRALVLLGERYKVQGPAPPRNQEMQQHEEQLQSIQMIARHH